MLNVIIFLVGALIMFYMALRSVRARQQLRTKGVCVQATVSGTVQSRDGAAYVLEFTTAGGSHEFEAAEAQQLAALHEMHCPEAEYFIEHMLPCFAQNLDELTRGRF